MTATPAKLKLVCDGQAHAARLVDAATGQPWEPPGDVVIDAHYRTPEKPWETPPVHEHTADGRVVRTLKDGVPAPPMSRALVTVHLPGGGHCVVPAEVEAPEGTPPFRLQHCRLEGGK